MRTPRWLGYLMQRPENHAHHHARGNHYGNSADLSVIDLLFGTFHDAADFPMATGFYEGASARVPQMLVGRDVSAPERAEAQLKLQP